ncbi:MAG: hypothetical protein ACLQU2_33980, partial [Candidatus Binataceae bacterium]
SFDRSTRTQYLLSLMGSVFGISWVPHIGNGVAPFAFVMGCADHGRRADNNTPAVLVVPSGPNGDKPSSGNDGQYYDGYVLFDRHDCSDYGQNKPVASGYLEPLFAPLDPNDPSKLGYYRPWFFLRRNAISVYKP